MTRIELEWMQGVFAVCRLAPDAPLPEWADASCGFISITRTDRELSIVTLQARVPEDVRAERGWRAMRIAGTLDFSLVGILAKLTDQLARERIPVFVISTFDTDILLVKQSDAERAGRALGVREA